MNEDSPLELGAGWPLGVDLKPPRGGQLVRNSGGTTLLDKIKRGNEQKAFMRMLMRSIVQDLMRQMATKQSPSGM